MPRFFCLLGSLFSERAINLGQDVFLDAISLVVRLSHVASKERVHLLIAVDALGCPCFLDSLADQELVGHGVQ